METICCIETNILCGGGGVSRIVGGQTSLRDKQSADWSVGGAHKYIHKMRMDFVKRGGGCIPPKEGRDAMYLSRGGCILNKRGRITHQKIIFD